MKGRCIICTLFKSYVEFMYVVKMDQQWKCPNQIILPCNRCDLSKNCHHFSNPPLARSMCGDWHKQPGCRSQPFFKLPLENIVVDELHLMLRVTDRLEEGLIMDIMKWDEVNKWYFNNLLICLNYM